MTSEIVFEHRSRKPVWWFIGVTLALTWGLMAWMILAPKSMGPLGRYASWIGMWIPGVVSLVIRLVNREGFKDIGWRIGPLKYWLIALFAPLLCAVAAYGISAAVGAIHLAPPGPPGREGTPFELWMQNLSGLPLMLIPMGLFVCLGEELGWRGYMLPRMIQSGFKYPLHMTGLVWILYHLPIVVFGSYMASMNPLLSILQYALVVWVFALLIGKLYLAGLSLWPAVLLHFSHNTLFQDLFDPHFTGYLKPLLVGESGLLTLAGYMVITLLVSRTSEKTTHGS